MNIRAFLDGARPPRWAFLFGGLLALIGVDLGLASDDHFFRANLMRDPRLPELHTAPWDAFLLFPPDAGIDQGFAAWWSHPGGVAHHMRPLSSLLHALDFTLWPAHPWLMHVHSALWYGAVCAVAAALYRRLLTGWAAGLAALLFVIDYTHGALAGWIANRNALIAGALGLAAVYAHHRARAEARRAFAIAAPLLLAAGLAAGEVALSASAYLLAYAVCLEAGDARRKARSMAPYAAVLLVWAGIHSALGFGTVGSGFYLDPRHDPLGLLAALPARVALIFGAELGGMGPDFWPLVGTGPRAGLLVAAVGATAFAALALWPTVRKDATARFFALGAALSALPLAAVFPSSRLGLIPSFGLLALIARAFAAFRDGEPLPAVGASRRLAVGFAAIVGGMHLALSPPMFAVMVRKSAAVGVITEELMRGLPDDPALARQRLVLVNPPDLLFTLYVRSTLASAGRAVPAGSYLLGLGTHALEVERADDRTLVLRDPSGLYGDGFSMLLRPHGSPMPVGTRVVAQTAVAEVRAAREGVPTEVAFTFAAPLSDSSLRFVAWDGATLVPFALPAVGARVSLPARGHPLLRTP